MPGMRSGNERSYVINQLFADRHGAHVIDQESVPAAQSLGR